jgi:PAS domain S-box-containing protein
MNNEALLRLLIDNISDPIWLVDAHFRIVVCNAAFKTWVQRFIGCELHEGDNVLFDGKNKTYAEKFETCYQLALHGSSFHSVEDMLVSGEMRYTAVTFNPIKEHGRVTMISCSARDITEQRKHRQKIEDQNAALREIAFIESHNIRGPVATILGLQQLFNHDDLSDPVNRTILEGITKVTHELDIVVREVVRKSNEIGPMP